MFRYFLLACCFCWCLTCLTTVSAGETQDLQTVLSQFDTYARSAQKQWGIPGMAIAIVKEDRAPFTRGQK